MAVVTVTAALSGMAGKGGNKKGKGGPKDNSRTGPAGKQVGIGALFPAKEPAGTQAIPQQPVSGAAVPRPVEGDVATPIELNSEPEAPGPSVQGIPPLPARDSASKRPRVDQDEDAEPQKKYKKRSFKPQWCLPITQNGFGFHWLEQLVVNTATGETRLFCTTCKSQQKKNHFVNPGSTNYKTSSLRRHQDSGKHKAAQAAVDGKVAAAGAMHGAAAHQATETEASMLNNMALAYWLI